VRFLVAGCVLYAVQALRRRRRRLWGSRGELIGASVVGAVILGDIGLLALAEREVPAGLAALVIASVPVWIVLIRLAHGEQIGRRTSAAVALGLVGVAALVLPGERTGGAPIVWLLVLVLAAVVEAAGQFYSTRVSLPDDALASTAVQLIAAAVALLLASVAVGEVEAVSLERFSGLSLAAFAYLVGPGSLLAYTAFVWLLANAPLSLVSTYAYVNPLVAVFLGWALLSERVTGALAAGALAIIASIALIVRREERSVPSPASAREPPVRSGTLRPRAP
jgi:drug/metabolite transporter (DMT)-like permease